ncbi:hypothetical protein HDV63DRAFT_142057 [Trichoderma sp. SZMC 28014]
MHWIKVDKQLMLMTTLLFPIGSCLPVCKLFSSDRACHFASAFHPAAPSRSEEVSTITLLQRHPRSANFSPSFLSIISLHHFSPSFLLMIWTTWRGSATSYNHNDPATTRIYPWLVNNRQFFFRGDSLLGPLLSGLSVQAICAITTRLLLTRV